MSNKTSENKGAGAAAGGPTEPTVTAAAVTESATPSPSTDSLSPVLPPSVSAPSFAPGVEAYMEISPQKGVAIRSSDPNDQRPEFVRAFARNEKVSFIYTINGVQRCCLQTQAKVAQNYLRALLSGREIKV